VEATEDSIPYSVKTLIDHILSLMATIIIISSATPFIIFALAPVIVVYVLVQRYFIPSNRQLKRMLSVSKSPIFAHFSESQAGVMTLRAYKLTDKFTKIMEDNIDQSFRNNYAISFSNR
jgi:ATP-binding cassette, subfamily C (CFTR/MRP), member 1